MIHQFPYLKPYTKKKLKNWLEKQRHEALSEYHSYEACENGSAALQCRAAASVYNSIAENYLDHHMEKAPRKEYRVIMIFQGYLKRYIFGSIEERQAFLDCYEQMRWVFDYEGQGFCDMMNLYSDENLEEAKEDERCSYVDIEWLEGKGKC